MKKCLWICLIISLASPLLAKPLNNTKLHKWHNTYSIDRMSQKSLSALASGVLYLMMLENPFDTSSASKMLANVHSQLSEFGSHYDCYNALVKAYEDATLLSVGKQKVEKNRVWKETLASYYTDLTSRLESESATITFGRHKGKRFPSLLRKVPAPKVDLTYHNFIRTNQARLPIQKQAPRTTVVQVKIVTKTI